MEESETFAVYQVEFEQLRAGASGVDQMLFRFLANEVRMLNERLLEALYMPVEKRVLRRLVELARLYPGAASAADRADAGGAGRARGGARATVNQVLREEEKRGTLELSRGRIRVLDVSELERRAR